MKKFLCGVLGAMMGFWPLGELAAMDCTDCEMVLNCLINVCKHYSSDWGIDVKTANGRSECRKQMEANAKESVDNCLWLWGGSYEVLQQAFKRGWGDLMDEWAVKGGGAFDFDGACYKNSRFCCADCASDCVGETGWVAASPGYQKYTIKSCKCGTCEEKTTYRCAAGYFGDSNDDGTSGCDKCPLGQISPAGTTAVTGCYMQSGSDASGKYSYNPVCYWQE